nr:hypothetical protein [Tanacetum cinerariifolium]
MKMKPDIENMMLNEYLEYEAVKERRLWDNVRSKRSPTSNTTFDPQPIHTAPPNDDYVASATKSILDELLEELGDKIVNVTMVDEEVDSNPTRDIEELERLLTKDPQSYFTEIQMFLEEANLEHGLEYDVSSSCRANAEDSSVLFYSYF